MLLPFLIKKNKAKENDNFNHLLEKIDIVGCFRNLYY